MQSVDTNMLVRIIARDDAKQVAAAEAFIKRGAWVSHIVLVETIWVLGAVYDRSASELALAIQMLLDHKSLSIEDPEVIASAIAVFRSNPTIGFSDCLILETARKAGHLPLGTFDRKLSKLRGVERIGLK
jgi:predicted nucleic-acid-binding protein